MLKKMTGNCNFELHREAKRHTQNTHFSKLQTNKTAFYQQFETIPVGVNKEYAGKTTPYKG